MSWKDPVIGQWGHYYMDSQFSSKEFYSLLQQFITGQQMPDVRISTIIHKQGGLFSANREYLRVSRREDYFDICAAPFGKGFFFSSWHCSPEWYGSRSRTFFQADTQAMFRDCVHQCVLMAIDKISETKGIK